MSERAYNMKSALPNKVLDEDGNTTDLFGNPIVATSEAYKNKPSLPNKWLNPDGTYSTLTEIIAGAIDTDVFVIVDELPEEGNPNKIYLVSDGEGGFIEYHYVDGNWDPIGTVEIDLSQYSTTDEMNAAILAALNQAKAYADALFADVPPQVIYYDGSKTNYAFWNDLIKITKPVLIYMFDNNNSASFVSYINNPSLIPSTSNTRKVVFICPSDYTRDSGGYTYYSQQKWTYNLVFTNGEVVAIGTSFDETKINTIDPTRAYGSAFEPTQSYHPATKKYVDDSLANVGGTPIYFWGGTVGTAANQLWTEIFEANKTQPVVVVWRIANDTSDQMYFSYIEANQLPTAKSTTGHVMSPPRNGNGSYQGMYRSQILSFTYTNNAVTNISATSNGTIGYLAVNTNYNTPYTPQYPGSPATKKYVDDAIANSVTSALGGEY